MARLPLWLDFIPGTVVAVDKAGNAISSPQFVGDAMFAGEGTTGVHRRKPVGWKPPTGYSFVHASYTRAQGYCAVEEIEHPSNFAAASGVVGAGGSGVFNSLNHFNDLMSEGVPDTASLVSAAQIAALTKIKQQKVNLAVAYGERKQTAKLVGDTVNRIVGTVRHLRRGEIRSAMSSLGISAKRRQPRGSNWTNQWLELQYGWKPLLSDVYGAADALSKRDAGDWRITAKASRSSETNTQREWIGLGTGSARARLFVKVRIDATPDNEAIISLSSMGITNPLTLGWELLPYSFVVDWFLPVGKWLDVLDAGFGYSGYTTTSVVSDLHWEEKGSNYSLGGFRYTNQYYGKKKVYRLDRTVSSGFPIPAFPSFKDPRSLGHMANALALLSQVFGR